MFSERPSFPCLFPSYDAFFKQGLAKSNHSAKERLDKVLLTLFPSCDAFFRSGLAKSNHSAEGKIRQDLVLFKSASRINSNEADQTRQVSQRRSKKGQGLVESFLVQGGSMWPTPSFTSHDGIRKGERGEGGGGGGKGREADAHKRFKTFTSNPQKLRFQFADCHNIKRDTTNQINDDKIASAIA